MNFIVRAKQQTRRSRFYLLAMMLAVAVAGCNTLPTKMQAHGVMAENDSQSARSVKVVPKVDPGSVNNQEPTRPAGLNTSRPLIPTDIITLLFRKEETKGPNRLDPTSQAATRALERELLNRRYKVPSTSPQLLSKLDRNPNIIVSFAPDAGFSMTYSIYKNLRPDPGVNTYAAEVSIRARVFVGSSVLSVEEGRSTVRFRATGQQQREYGERRAMERAAERAAVTLVQRVDARLKSLTPEQINEYLDLGDPEYVVTDDTVLPPPSGVQPLPPPAQVHALVIGVSDYSHASRLNGKNFKNLKGVTVDLQNIASTFAELGLPQSRIKVLRDRDATAAKVRAETASMARAAGPEDLLIFYISAHGSQANFKREGMSIPIFYDFSLKHLNSAPDFSELLDLLTQSAADRFVMIVDTCHAGGAVSILPTVVVTSEGVQSSNTSGAPSPRMIMRTLNKTRNIAVLSSARFEESAWERSGGGLFTYFLTKGLKEAHKDEVLRDIVEKRVAEPVIRESRKICLRTKCPTGQQTPVLGFSGGGDMIRL